MMKDTSEFKQRFKRWQEGEKVYEAGKILPEVIVTADDPIKKLVEDVNARSSADFVNRAKDPNRMWIQDWENKNKIATHKLSWAEVNGKTIVYPNVQNIDGRLHDFTDPKYKHDKWDALDSAIERGDTLQMTPKQAKMYTENYKKYYPKGKTFDCGKSLPKYDKGGLPITFPGYVVKNIAEKLNRVARKEIHDKIEYATGINTLPMDTIRKRAYDNIVPFSYPGSVGKAIERAHKAIVENKKEEQDNNLGARDDIFATYLQIPENQRHAPEYSWFGAINKLQKSKYVPSKGNKNNDYYSITNPLFPTKHIRKSTNVLGENGGHHYEDVGMRDLWTRVYKGIYDGYSEKEKPLNIGESAISTVLADLLGRHTISRGHDSNGEYMSYYDLWDLAPISRGVGNNGTDETLGIGKPVHIYDRMYLDDYFNLDSPSKSTWLPEVEVVTLKKHDKGKSIHINPANKGKFNATKKRTGKTTEQLAHSKNPLTRKRAIFALNSRKFKH